QEEGGISLDRLRPVPRLRRWRREPLHQAALSRRLHRRGVCNPRAGARRQISARLRSPARQPGGDLDVLGRDRLWRAQAAGRPAAAAQSAAHWSWGVGMMGLSFAQTMFKQKISVADLNPAARETALQNGADVAYDPTEPD